METKKNIAFVDFKEFFISLGCFSIHQVKVWNEKFDRNNLRRWEKQGKLIRLRQGFYTFPTVTEHGDAPFYFANKIYAPSYISLESGLSFHGIIPEGVIQITSVTARKTKIFQNNLGSYIYRSIKPDLMFGYTIQQSTLSHRWSIMMASPEKALLDYLYLNPHYDSKQDMLELRFDSDFMHAELNIEVLDEYLEKFQSKILEVRVRRLKEVYL
ncbi:MAG: hypothetical protein WCR91_07925 [Sphaerochaetaceae bacterium]|jgi:predicted transcriptional regulator of viral defense system|nr:hypothetical protein [Sphaerochaetaceae bacterium]